MSQVRISIAKVFWTAFYVTLIWSGLNLLCQLSSVSFFSPLYSFNGTCCALLVLFILPSIAIFCLLNSRLGFEPITSLLLASPLSVAVISLAILWVSYISRFSIATLYPTLFILSLVMYLLSSGVEKRQRARVFGDIASLFTTKRLIFFVLLLIFAILVWFPWNLEGTMTSKGVSIISMGDYTITYGLTVALLDSGVPPRNPFFTSEPLRYYYLMNLYTASLVKLSMGGLTVQSATAVTSFIIGVVFFSGFFAIARCVLGNFRAALFATLLTTFIDRFDIVPVWIYRLVKGSWPIQVDDWLGWEYFRFPDNWVCIQWIPTQVLGTLFLFMFLYIFFRRGFSPFQVVIGTICLAASAGFSTFAALGGAAALGLYFLIEIIILFVRGRPRSAWLSLFRQILRMACMGIAAFFLCGPLLVLFLSASLPGGSVFHSLRWPPLDYWFISGYQPSSFASYIFQLILVEIADLGPAAIMGIIGIILWRRLKDRLSLKITLSIIISSFIFANFVWMGSANPGNSSSKVIGISLVWGLALFAGLCFRERLRVVEFIKGIGWSEASRNCLVIITKGIFWLFIALGLAGTLYALNARWAVAMHIPADEYSAILFIRESLPQGAFVQRGPHVGMNFIPGWAWRMTPVANYWQGVQCAVNPARVRAAQRAIDEAFRTDNSKQSQSIMRRYKVDYLFIGHHERERYEKKELSKFDESPTLFRVIYRKGETAIYEVVKNPSSM